ncbi:hypothetical protein QQF64_030855 [Cirrhinus molitorella]|uniref:Uncharacterized protein n=1 Tax=Cirrhinus molitorella TaxID=172907 RepID=A0ABR3N4M7_9TELE
MDCGGAKSSTLLIHSHTTERQKGGELGVTASVTEVRESLFKKEMFAQDEFSGRVAALVCCFEEESKFTPLLLWPLRGFPRQTQAESWGLRDSDGYRKPAEVSPRTSESNI